MDAVKDVLPIVIGIFIVLLGYAHYFHITKKKYGYFFNPKLITSYKTEKTKKGYLIKVKNEK
jgi:hypothetical protein